MSHTNPTFPSLDSIDLKALPEHKKRQFLQVPGLDTHHQLQDGILKSTVITQGNNQPVLARAAIPELAHQKTIRSPLTATLISKSSHILPPFHG
jgi:hypothetical protein